MKYAKFLSVVLFSIIISFYGCKDAPKTEKEDTSKSSKVIESTTPQKATPPKPATAEPAQNALGVWHYTCSIGCPGGSGLASNCSNCGNRLAHNTKYHASASTVDSSAPFSNQPAATDTASTAPAAPEPAQNAAGVWHYTCAQGCIGGAGAVTTCKTCGGTLSHNQGYH